MEKQDKLNEIYKAALKVFGAYGFKKATMEDIAGELGLTKGALYQYAKDKRDLYDKAVAFGMLHWQNRAIEAIGTEDDVKSQLIVLCTKAFQYLSEDSDFKKVLMKDPGIFPIYFSEDPYKDINNSSMSLLRSILERGVREGKFRDVKIELVTRLMFLIYKMLILEVYVMEEESPELMFDELIRLITEGLFIHR